MDTTGIKGFPLSGAARAEPAQRLVCLCACTSHTAAGAQQLSTAASWMDSASCWQAVHHCMAAAAVHTCSCGYALQVMFMSRPRCCVFVFSPLLFLQATCTSMRCCWRSSLRARRRWRAASRSSRPSTQTRGALAGYARSIHCIAELVLQLGCFAQLKTFCAGTQCKFCVMCSSCPVQCRRIQCSTGAVVAARQCPSSMLCSRRARSWMFVPTGRHAYWSEQHCGMLLHAVCGKPTVACTVRVYCRARTR